MQKIRELQKNEDRKAEREVKKEQKEEERR